MPDGVFYHRKCRSMFTLKRELNRIVAKTKQNETASLVEESSRERRASIRSNPSTSRVYEKECIFCGKKDNYKKGIKEGLTQARELIQLEKLQLVSRTQEFWPFFHVIWLQPKVTTIALVTGITPT